MSKKFFAAAAALALLAACSDDSSSSSSSVECEAVTLSSSQFQDSRDCQVYSKVTIGSQTWMAQNLNYADSAATKNLQKNSWCYDNDESNCTTYGRLYTWTAALDISSSYQEKAYDTSDGEQGICPEGWHLPNETDWETLLTYVEENNGNENVGTSLKAATNWRGFNGVSSGSDKFGFSALPGGYMDTQSNFDYESYSAFFWSATGVGTYYAYYKTLNYSTEIVESLYMNKNAAFSVRCVQD